MKQTLLLESVMGQTRLAVLEDRRLVELYYERPGEAKLEGNIYVGRVQNVLQGMNAAFVDIGLDKNGFLYAGDIRFDTRSDMTLAKQLDGMRIEKMLKRDCMMPVQVVKEPGGTKGPRLSGHITLPGRLMVLLPEMRYIGVSRKITDEAERDRLYAIGHALSNEKGTAGMILRTASLGATEAELRAEYLSLSEQWASVRNRCEHALKPGLIRADADLAFRAVRDFLGKQTEVLFCEGRPLYEKVRAYVELIAPDKAERVQCHAEEIPLFDLYRVDAEAEKLESRHVWLKSGGSLVIEETEALTVIDVNTAKFTGDKKQEETLFKLNCEAAEEIMRQVRLRDLGGIIVVDFIDMAREDHRAALMDRLRALAERDRNRCNVLDMTTLGLVEMTRKKQRQPLSKQLMHICSACGGNGVVPSYETVAWKASREIWKKRRNGQTGSIIVEANASVIGWVKTVAAPTGGPLEYIISNETDTYKLI